MNKLQFAIMIVPMTICYCAGAFTQICIQAFCGGMDDWNENKSSWFY